MNGIALKSVLRALDGTAKSRLPSPIRIRPGDFDLFSCVLARRSWVAPNTRILDSRRCHPEEARGPSGISEPQ
jgi:hypothetical protein